MPGENIQDWSVTAANNGAADSLINWAEGMARAAANDSARSMMAATAKWRNLLNGSITTGGTANAQTFTSGVSYTSVPTGINVRLKIGVTNTSAATLNMDGIGGVAILDHAGNALTGGELFLNGYAYFLYNGTNWILIGAPYQAGTFTPAFSFGGGTTGITYSAQSGLYTRTGRIVHFQMRVTLTSKGSSTGTWLITGLPFTANAGAYSAVAIYQTNLGTLTGYMMGLVNQGATTISLYGYASGVGTVALTEVSAANTTDLIITGSYIV